MEIVRNDLWNQCLKDAMKMYRIDETNEKCESLADATWKMKMSYKNHEKKKDSRQIIILDKAPTVVNEQRNQVKLCQATTMAGKPCSSSSQMWLSAAPGEVIGGDAVCVVVNWIWCRPPCECWRSSFPSASASTRRRRLMPLGWRSGEK